MTHIKLKTTSPFIVRHISKYSEIPRPRFKKPANHIKELFWMLKTLEHHGQISQPDLKQILASFHVRWALCEILWSQITMLLIQANKGFPVV